jgi:hypothetical protein
MMEGPTSAWPRAGTTGVDGATGPAEPGAPSSVAPGGAPPPARLEFAPPRRRWPWIVAVVLLVAATAGASAIAWDQRETAEQWRERAEALEAQRDDALGRGEALQVQLEDVAELLAASEMDVTELEERIRILADEKAQAEDTATTVQVERDVLADVSTQVASAVEALDVCITRLFELQESSVEAFNRSAAGEPVDVGPLNEQARSTTTFCNEARSAAAAAATAADRIPG